MKLTEKQVRKLADDFWVMADETFKNGFPKEPEFMELMNKAVAYFVREFGMTQDEANLVFQNAIENYVNDWMIVQTEEAVISKLGGKKVAEEFTGKYLTDARNIYAIPVEVKK